MASSVRLGFTSRLSSVFVLLSIAGAGCLFPEYTFDESSQGGFGGATTSATTTVSATTSSAGGMGGQGGMGGMPPTEDCFTAGDEDGDSLADCADPDCAPDLECVDAIPVGWGTLGYLALFDGSSAQDPACPAGTGAVALSGNSDLQGITAQCSACGCQAPSWAGCDFNQDLDNTKPGRQGLYAGDQLCGGPAFTGGVTLTVPNPWNLACTASDSSPGAQICAGGPCNTSVRAATAAPTGGTCAPSGGQPIMNTPTWDDTQKACSVSSGLLGCSSPQACVIRPKAPFENGVCIGRAGDQPCPAGSFSQKITTYSGFSDTRNCTGCTCGSGAGGACALTVDLHSDSGCATAIGAVTSGQCVNLTGNPTVAGRDATVSLAPTGGTCPSTGGGLATGGVVETGPSTFCCQP